MKAKFPGYFKPSSFEFEELWKDAIMVFDTSSLLNLYRYSNDTRNHFLRVLDRFKGRLWMPYQTAKELLNNRLTVISLQEKAYQSSITEVDNVRRKFEDINDHPFIEREILGEFLKISDKVKGELEKSKREYTARINEDDIIEFLVEIFDESVGNPFAREEELEIFTEGKKRYEKFIPPGYKDASKSTDGKVDSNIYGDLIIWKQVMTKAKEEKKPLLFITDDKKEDWWLIHNKKTIGPRPELKQEFKNTTGCNFHMYTSRQFLKYSMSFLNEDVNENALFEIEEVNQRNFRNPEGGYGFAKGERIRPTKDVLAIRRKRVEMENVLKKFIKIRENIERSIMLIEDSNFHTENDELEVEYINLKNEHAVLTARMDDLINDIYYFEKLENNSTKPMN